MTDVKRHIQIMLREIAGRIRSSPKAIGRDCCVLRATNKTPSYPVSLGTCFHRYDKKRLSFPWKRESRGGGAGALTTCSRQFYYALLVCRLELRNREEDGMRTPSLSVEERICIRSATGLALLVALFSV